MSTTLLLGGECSEGQPSKESEDSSEKKVDQAVLEKDLLEMLEAAEETSSFPEKPKESDQVKAASVNSEVSKESTEKPVEQEKESADQPQPKTDEHQAACEKGGRDGNQKVENAARVESLQPVVDSSSAEDGKESQNNPKVSEPEAKATSGENECAPKLRRQRTKGKAEFIEAAEEKKEEADAPRPSILDQLPPVAPKRQPKAASKKKKGKKVVEDENEEASENSPEEEEEEVKKAPAKRAKGKADEKKAKSAKEKAESKKAPKKDKEQKPSETPKKQKGRKKAKANDSASKMANAESEQSEKADSKKRENTDAEIKDGGKLAKKENGNRRRERAEEPDEVKLKKQKQSRKSSAYHQALRKARLDGKAEEVARQEAKQARNTSEIHGSYIVFDC